MNEKDKVDAVASYLERELDSFYIIGFSGDTGIVQAFNLDSKEREIVKKHNKRFDIEHPSRDEPPKKTESSVGDTPQECIDNLKYIVSQQQKKLEVIRMVKELYKDDKEKLKDILEAEASMKQKCDGLSDVIKSMESVLKHVG